MNEMKKNTIKTPKKSRDPLVPKPILNRRLLTKAWIEHSTIVYRKDEQQRHLDNFYQLLHRQQYPSIPDFLKEYYRLEAEKKKEHTEKKHQKKKNQDEEKKEEEIASSVTHHNMKSMTPNHETTQTSIISKSSSTSSLSAGRTKSSFHKNPIGKRLKNIRQLPNSLLEFLGSVSLNEPGFVTLTSKVASATTSLDGTTTKLAVELQDGHLVESVIMRHKNSRVTLCVSSQVGCAMGCTFCATGTMGIRGNLCTGEILEQLVHANKILQQLDHEEADGIRNIVFMGMGEPLNNYNNVVEACRTMMERKLWNLAHGHVTVSTVGVTPKMRQLTRELPQVNLALSLHAPNQTLRQSIVPTARMYPIDDMVQALFEHMQFNPPNTTNQKNKKNASKNRRKNAMIEYVMLEGETSTLQSAHELGKLCENRNGLVVNLIPYNKTDVKDKLSCPSESQMMEFRNIVSSYGGTFCTIRRTMGADIAGACGQLVVAEEEAAKKRQQQKQNNMDIEDSPFLKNTKQNLQSNKTNKSSNKGTVIISKSSNNKLSKSSKKNEKDKSLIHTTVSDTDRKNRNSNNNLDHWIKPLAIATGIAGSLFIASSIMLLSSGKRRR